MKFCTKCGNKIKEGNKFCSKCGSPTELYLEEKKKLQKQKSEENKEKLLLGIGTLLIIIASVIFAYANWNEMTPIFKVLFLLIESFLFLAISLFSKRVNEKLPYKFLWFVGISFIPFIFNLIACDKVLGEYLSYEGAGIYVFLAISSLICALAYYLSSRLLKSNLCLYFTYIFSYLVIIFALYVLKLDEIFKYNLILPILSVINLLFCIFYTYFKNENTKRTCNIFLTILVLVSSIAACNYISHYEFKYILIGIVLVFNMASLILLLFKSDKNGIIYAYPFIIYSLLEFGVSGLFINYTNVIIFTSVLGYVLINFVINLKDDRALSIISFILMLVYTTLIAIAGDVSYLTSFIISIILIANYIFIIKLYPKNTEASISKVILPILSLVSVYNFINIFVNMDTEVIYLIASVICYTISIIFHQKNKDKFTKTSFEISSYVYLAFSTIIILLTNSKEISFVLNEIVWLYYYLFNSILKKDKEINIVLLVMLIFNFVACSVKFDISIYYSLIFIGGLTAVLDFINRRFNKGSYYIYISLAAITLAALYDFMGVSILGIGLLVLSYSFVYYLLVNKHNLHFTYKYLYTLIGFLIIYNLFHHFIDDRFLANLFILITNSIIIISMYLLRVDTDRKVFSYYIAPAFAAINLIDSIIMPEKYFIALNMLVSISLILVYFEGVFKLKEEDKVIFELVFLSIIHIFTVFDVVIVNFVLAAFYIFYSFYKKRSSFTILGTVLLIASLLINIMKIAKNITVTYVLLVIGLAMLGSVFYIEAKKNNKK